MTANSKRLVLLFGALLLVPSGCARTRADEAGEPAVTQGLSFRDSILIGDPELNPGDPYLRVSQDKEVFVSWSQDNPQAEGHNTRDLFVSAVKAGGQELGDPRRANDRPISSHGGENLAKFTIGLDGSLTAIMPLVGSEMHTGDLMTSYAEKGEPFSSTNVARLNDDNVVANHGFTDIATSPDGRIFASWVDGRNDLDQSELFMAVSEDGGKTFSKNYQIGEEACNCCRPNIVFLDGGRTIALSHRFVDPDNVRNHVMVRSVDGGKTFSDPIPISDDGWVSHGCPHAGISIAADQQEVIHAVWWTGGRTKQEAGIYYTRSEDGGQSFAPRQLIAEARDDIVMHTHITVDQNDTLYAAWVNLEDNQPKIFLAYRPIGETEWSPIQQVNDDPDWYAFYPMLSTDEENLYLSWMERKGEGMRIKLRTSYLAGL